MNCLSLFSGIGCHDEGLRAAGINIVGQVEIEPMPIAVLEKHFPGVNRWSDVRHVSADLVRSSCGAIDLITGGFPCTDVSVAGKGAGIAKGTRSGLWREMFRIIRGLRPAWIVIENVPALRTRGYDRIYDALARIGYGITPVVVGAEHCGAPHRRHRVWIVGCSSKVAVSAVHGHLTATEQPLSQEVEQFSRRKEKSYRAVESAGGGSRPSLLVEHPQSIERRQVGQSAGERQAGFGGAGQGVAVADGSRSTAWISGKAEPRRQGIAEVADNHRCRPIWPARPGQPQYDWEAPRLVEWPLGASASMDARELVRLGKRHNKETLRAAGNANPPIVPFLIGSWILAQENAA